LLVLAVGAPDRYPPAAARFGARLVAERQLSVNEAQLAFAALQTLPGSDPLAGGEAPTYTAPVGIPPVRLLSTGTPPIMPRPARLADPLPSTD
jgi:hypothetical protein